MRWTVVLILVLVVACVSGCAGRRSASADAGATRVLEARELALRAQQAERAGRDLDAIDLYRRALALSRDLHAAWNNLGILLMRQQQYLEAKEAFTIAADLAPTDPRPVANIGQIYLDLGYDERALEYFDRALARDPDFLPALRGAILSSRRLARGDPRAPEWVERALVLETDPVWVDTLRNEKLRLDNRGRP